MTADDLPALYRDADLVSRSAQRNFLTALGTSLSLLIICATISVLNSPQRGWALVQCVTLLGSFGLTAYIGYSQPQRTWYGARALAESIRTIAWRFVMRAEPYDKDDAPSRELFIANLKKLFDDNVVSKHVIARSNDAQITEAMNRLRSANIQERKKRYRDDRIEQQRSWYKSKAAYNRLRSKLWLALLLIFHGIAAFCILGKAVWPSLPYWPTDIFITAASSAVAWAQTKRFEELSASYNLTAHEIGLLGDKLRDTQSSKDFSDFVGDAENAFSREHTQWRARRDVR